MMKFVCSLVLVLSLPFVAFAADIDCGGTQQEMNVCAVNTYANEGVALGFWYQKALVAQGDETGRELLQAAQQAWLAYREAQCASDADAVRGGSMAPAIQATCLEQLTRARVVELQSKAESPLGGGPGWPEDLARMMQIAGDRLPEGVFWDPMSMVTADLDRDGAYDMATLGIAPGSLDQPDSVYVLMVHASGSPEVALAEIPVGEGGLCSPSATLDVEYPDDEAPLLVVDDAACDAFRFKLKADQKTLKLFRN